MFNYPVLKNIIIIALIMTIFISVGCINSYASTSKSTANAVFDVVVEIR